jgi:hypothetical protein
VFPPTVTDPPPAKPRSGIVLAAAPNAPPGASVPMSLIRRSFRKISSRYFRTASVKPAAVAFTLSPNACQSASPFLTRSPSAIPRLWKISSAAFSVSLNVSARNVFVSPTSRIADLRLPTSSAHWEVESPAAADFSRYFW